MPVGVNVDKLKELASVLSKIMGGDLSLGETNPKCEESTLDEMGVIDITKSHNEKPTEVKISLEYPIFNLEKGYDLGCFLIDDVNSINYPDITQKT